LEIAQSHQGGGNLGLDVHHGCGVSNHHADLAHSIGGRLVALSTRHAGEGHALQDAQHPWRRADGGALGAGAPHTHCHHILLPCEQATRARRFGVASNCRQGGGQGNGTAALRDELFSGWQEERQQLRVDRVNGLRRGGGGGSHDLASTGRRNAGEDAARLLREAFQQELLAVSVHGDGGTQAASAAGAS
jgi:hypothetical protein